MEFAPSPSRRGDVYVQLAEKLSDVKRQFSDINLKPKRR